MGWKQKLSRTFLTHTFVQSIKREPVLVWKRLLCLSPLNLLRIHKFWTQDDLLLNLGGGSHEAIGWINIDLEGSTNGFRWDLRWGIPLPEASVRRIHCEHFLEHLEYGDEAEHFLTECCRILKPDGEFRLIVPDAGKYVWSYAHRNQNFWNELRDLGGTPKPFETEMEIINQAFRMGSDHRFAYDAKTLKRLLKRTGFTLAQEQTYFPKAYLDQSDRWRIIESLYMIASKRKNSLHLVPKVSNQR